VRRYFTIFSLSLFGLLPAVPKAFSQTDTTSGPKLELKGYIKSLNGLQFANHLDSAVSTALIHNRLNFSLQVTTNFAAHLELRNRIFYGEDVKLVPGFGKMIAADPGYLDLSELWLDSRSVVIHSVADRAYLKFADDSWDIRLGRQRINWGISTIWNPNDLFNAYNFLDFDYEERPGSDGLRLQYSIATNTVIEAAVSPSRKSNDAIAAAMLRWNIAGYDMQAIAGLYRTDLVAGFGWAGNLGEAGLKGEISYFHPRKKQFDTTDAFEATLTLDHMIGEYYLSVSGLYNSAATDRVQDAAGLFARSLSPKNLMPFRYTFYGSVSHSFSPIFSVAIAAIYSPKFNSFIFFPILSYSLAQDVDADLVAESYFNDASGIYKAAANAIYFRLRYSF